MGEVVHAVALVPAGLATCCLVADRSARRLADTTVSVLMLLAMIDVLWTRVLPVVLWAALLVVCGMLLAVSGRRGVTPVSPTRPITVHTALGSVVMAAALTLMMGSAPADPTSHHSGSAAMLTALVVAASVVFAASSFAAARRGRWQQRAEHIGMGVTVIAMGAAPLL